MPVAGGPIPMARSLTASCETGTLVVLSDLMTLPQVEDRPEPPGTVALWHRLAARDTASPKLWMDAYLAAFAVGGGLSLVSLDYDFKSFEKQGLDLILLNP